MAERTIAFGPAGGLALLVLPAALLRRSRRLALIGAGLLAVEAVPPYRAWVAERAQAARDRAEAAAASR